MAMINPYQLAQSQLGLSEQLIKKEREQQEADMATAGQMGSMEKKFNQQLRVATQQAEEELRKKQKKSKWGSLGKIVSMFAGPIAGPILSGLLSMNEMKRQSKHAEKQAKLAKAAALGVDTSRFSGTFLGEKAKDYEAQQESAFDKIIADTQVSTGDLLKSGLASGLTSMAMGKVGDKIKGGIGDVKAAKDISGTIAEAGGDVSSIDLGNITKDAAGDTVMSGEAMEAMNLLSDSQKKALESLGGFGEVAKLSNQGFVKNLFQQLKKPAGKAVEEEQANLLQSLLMIANQAGLK